ncbi:hypothetical protein [Vibrio phage phiKT1028]|nr:hypothetical protein [Vibrio phage phiKT1028]
MQKQETNKKKTSGVTPSGETTSLSTTVVETEPQTEIGEDTRTEDVIDGEVETTIGDTSANDAVSEEDEDDDDIIPENDEYRYIERVEVSNEKHKARLKEDFGWIGDLQVQEVDGQRSIRDAAGTYIISDTSIPESVFVQRWLDQFALGYVGATNYFDATTWGKLTHGHQRGVVITNDAGEPIFVIPPLSRAPFTPKEQYVLDLAHKSYANASSAEQTGDSHRAQEIIQGATELIKEYITDENVTVTELIPDWFYKKYHVVPYIKRALVYCRDVYGLNPAFHADWEMAEGIFTNIHNRRALNQHQLTFMEILTNGEWTPPEYDIVEDLGNPSPRVPSNSTDSDPFDN